MVGLTAEANSLESSQKSSQSSPCECESEPAQGSANTSPLHPPQHLKNLIFVRYFDHVIYNRTSALAIKPQKREAVGWLIYDCDEYIVFSWDRDADPPTLRGGDPKASGLVLLKSDILMLESLSAEVNFSHENSNWVLNSSKPTGKSEYAFRPRSEKLNSKEIANERHYRSTAHNSHPPAHS
jgi:hypothetical protein